VTFLISSLLRYSIYDSRTSGAPFYCDLYEFNSILIYVVISTTIMNCNMAYKSQIVSDLGVYELLIPRLINEALLANDRVKYFFSLLQMAKEHAEGHDDAGYLSSNERRACGVDDDRFDKVIQESAKIDSEHYRIPELGSILDHIPRCIREMMSPLDKVKNQLDETAPVQNIDAYNYSARLEVLKKQISPVENDIIANNYLDIITSGKRETGDTFHLLVMALHKELNLLQSKVSQESIDGASVYGLIETDKSSVRAFMNGVNQNALQIVMPYC
jgi:hypothetical protein